MKVRTKFGVGTVHSVVGDGIRVALPGDLLLRCNRSEVTPIETVRPASNRPKAIRDVPTTASAASRAIEALRFGIVPRDAIEEMTIGFDSLESWVSSRLPKANTTAPTISEVCGAFGTGKSHTMAAIRQIARSRQYLTAHVEVDGKGISLADPAGLLYHLWSTLSASKFDSVTPLVELNILALGGGAMNAQLALEGYERVYLNHETIRYLRTHGMLEPFEERMDALMACNDQESAAAIQSEMIAEIRARSVPIWEAREHIRPMRMVSRQVDERPDDFVDCLLGYTVLAKVAGLAGLVITIDEFEVEHQFSRDRLERIVGLVKALAHRFTKAGAFGVPTAIFIATVGQDGHLGDTVVSAMLRIGDGAIEEKRRVLRHWPARSLVQLARRIHNLYGQAYSATCDFDERQAHSLAERVVDLEAETSGQIRAFIKSYVAALDVTLGPPSA
jgi:hypothetical protein